MPESLLCGAKDGLTKSKPLRVMGFIRMQIVTLRSDTDRENVICEISGLAPSRSEGDMQSHFRFIGERFDPRESVGIGPHRVVDAAEINVEFAAAILQKMRKKKRHLVA